MVKFYMFQMMQNLKERGLTKAQTSRILNINRKTVSRYWNLTVKEYAALGKTRVRKASFEQEFAEVVVGWLRTYPDLSASQVFDWLRERDSTLTFSLRTVRRVVARLREKHDIPKQLQLRQYEAVEELPPGLQMQVDFGVTQATDSNGKRHKLYCFACVLSHSRFKYAEWSETPLTTEKLVQILERAFQYIGGIPKELLFDQDRLVLVSERHGDLLPTEAFEAYRQMRGFVFSVCRKADPESKGKVEAAVKYLKYNFAKHRLYRGITIWNKEQCQWLERTGNGLPHGTTKKVPAKVLPLEKAHLRPIPYGKTPTAIVSVAVRKDNTIVYRGNRYSLPIGTYAPGVQVAIQTEERGNETQLVVFQDRQELARHTLLLGQGMLSKQPEHGRNRQKQREQLISTFAAEYPDMHLNELATMILARQPRYLAEQLRVLKKLLALYGITQTTEAVKRCLHLQLYGATYVQQMLEASESSTAWQQAAPKMRALEHYARQLTPVSCEVQR